MGRDTPSKETAKIISLKNPFLLIPVYTPNKVPVINAINAEITTSSMVAGSLSTISSEQVVLIGKISQTHLEKHL